jgi:phosphoadenosine phosphosulfate reductase
MNRQIALNGFAIADLEAKAIELLKMYEPIALQRCDKGYIVGYSGGKDSDALVELFYKSGVKHHIIHNHTTADAPQTVYYIRQMFDKFQARGQTTEYIMPPRNIWKICEDKGILPTRKIRFCCAELKERKKEEYKHAVYSFGVRATESTARKKNRGQIEARNNVAKRSETFRFDDEHQNKILDVCYSNNYVVVNPLLYWHEHQIWEYLADNGMTIENMNPLYKMGFKRVGCIGCPMNTKARQELDRFPKYKALWMRTLEKILANGRKQFKSAQEYYDWWLGGQGINEFLQTKEVQK